MPGHAHPALFRIDSFAVPEAARDRFLTIVGETHAVLRERPGFVRDLIAEQSGGPGRFNFLTMVEWASQEAVDGAAAAVKARHAELGFDTSAFIAANGIEANLAFYRPVAVGTASG